MNGKIEVIGLGAGDINQLPLGIYRKLMDTSNNIMVRTMDHPVIKPLQEEGVSFHSFDYIYETNDQFANVYEQIVDDLLKAAEHDPVIYAVPGHPMLAEKTVQLLLNQTETDVTILGGQSYLDDLFTALKIDPIDGFQFVDGTSFERNQLDYKHHIVFCQVYDRFIASNVKLALLEDLPPDYQVTVIEAAGSEHEKMLAIPLEELDHTLEVNNLTSVYVPPAPDSLLNHTFSRLRSVIARLRGEDGCPWDREQTHESLRKYAVEEVYELIDAIDAQDDAGIVEELGDVLLQVMLHSQIGEDNGYFTVDDVIQGITNKMVFRHPHVFGSVSADSIEDAYQNWDERKLQEKGNTRKSVLDGVSKSLTSLAKAEQLQQKAAKTGFEWNEASEVWLKLEEELDEVKKAIAEETQEEVELEFGDVLFVLANLARYYKVNPEIALNRANQKFQSRFSFIEMKLAEQKKDIYQTPLAEMDQLWDLAKEMEKER